MKEIFIKHTKKYRKQLPGQKMYGIVADHRHILHIRFSALNDTFCVAPVIKTVNIPLLGHFCRDREINATITSNCHIFCGSPHERGFSCSASHLEGKLWQTRWKHNYISVGLNHYKTESILRCHVAWCLSWALKHCQSYTKQH